MGDKEKKKEAADKSPNNKDDQQHHQDNDNNRKDPARRRGENGRSPSYNGSYVSYSTNDSESSGHSGATNDDGYRHSKRKRETRRPKKERARHGRVAKPRRRTQKQSGRQRKRQTRRLAHAMDKDLEKALSISTIMTKVSTKSSVTVYSNELYHKQEKQSTTQLGRKMRKFYVKEILKRMKVTHKPSTLKIGHDDKERDNKTENIEIDEQEDSNRMT